MDQLLLPLGVTASGIKVMLGTAGSPAHHAD